MNLKIAKKCYTFILLMSGFFSFAAITFSLDQSQKVALNVANMNGEVVATLADQVLRESDYELMWDTEHVDPGVYFLHFTTAENAETIKLIVTI